MRPGRRSGGGVIAGPGGGGRGADGDPLCGGGGRLGWLICREVSGPLSRSDTHSFSETEGDADLATDPVFSSPILAVISICVTLRAYVCSVACAWYSDRDQPQLRNLMVDKYHTTKAESK